MLSFTLPMKAFGGTIMRFVLGVAVSAALLIPQAAAGETLEETAAVFGLREMLLNISLSPSGHKLAYISSSGASTEVVYVIDLSGSGEPAAIMQFSEQRGQLAQCDWATDDRLVCEAYYTAEDAGLLLGSTRLFSVNADGSKMEMLTQGSTGRELGYRQNGGDVIALDLKGEPNKILMTREWIKERSIGTFLANDEEGLGVDMVDVLDGRRTKVEKADSNAIAYLADENGRVRIKVVQPLAAGGMLSEKQLYYFRTPDSDRWKLLSRVTVDGQTYSGLYPVAVDSAKNVAYAFARQNGFEALFTIPLEESGTPQLVMSRPDADVNQLIRIGRDRRVVGASYATEKRQFSYLDAELKSLADKLHAALPGKPLITINGASADEGKLLLIASSDTDPGMTYLYDKSTRQLEPLLPLRSFMENRVLGKMTPVNFPASDGTQVPGYLTLPPGSDGKNIPAIVLPHGGPTARDEWGFDWLVQFFAARGYAVLQPNFRGSSGYGSEWFGRNGFQAWRTAIGDVNDAGRWLVAQGIADPDKMAIVGWSYGGYAALQSQVLDPKLYKAVIAVAPVTDLEQLRTESLRYTNGRLVDAFIGRGAHVTEGSPARNAGAFQAPVLLFHGDLDQNVDVNQSRVMKSRLQEAGKPVSYVEFQDVTHSLAENKVRFQMLTAMDEFLTKSLGR